MTTAQQAADPLSPIGLSAWMSFLRANSRLLQELDSELRERHGIPLGDFDVLAQIAEGGHDGLPMCELADAIVLSPSGLSRRVDRLESAGLVRRARAERDARNVETRLTPAGRALLRRLLATHRAGVQARFESHFTEQELESLAEMLARLTTEGPGEAPGDG